MQWVLAVKRNRGYKAFSSALPDSLP